MGNKFHSPDIPDTECGYIDSILLKLVRYINISLKVAYQSEDFYGNAWTCYHKCKIYGAQWRYYMFINLYKSIYQFVLKEHQEIALKLKGKDLVDKMDAAQMNSLNTAWLNFLKNNGGIEHVVNVLLYDQPKAQRQIIIYHYINGMTTEEIGQAYGITKNRVRQLLRHNLILLREFLYYVKDLGEFLTEL